ncbi:MAG: M48 family metalloprotease [Rhodanobacter sp.]
MARLVELGLMAALPGFMILLAVWVRLGLIAFERNPDALHEAIGLRHPRAGDFEEGQLANVVAEMAVAAGCQPPRLALIDSAACNTGILGEGEGATIIVTRGLVDHLDRGQTQALVGQAIASLANGDGLLAKRMLHLGMLIGLLMLIAQSPLDQAKRDRLKPLFRMRGARDSAADPAVLRSVLGNASSKPDDGAAPETTPNKWRERAMMPLTGSMLIGILIVPIAVMLLVAPLDGMIWRRRRLLADATAVQFTRDPQALAEAYAALSQADTKLDSRARWLGDLFVLDAGARSNLRVSSPYPRLATRIARLDAMGANVALAVNARRPLWVWLALGPLVALVVSLLGTVIVLCTWLSLALNGLFLVLPTALIHAVLRTLGHA